MNFILKNVPTSKQAIKFANLLIDLVFSSVLSRWCDVFFIFWFYLIHLLALLKWKQIWTLFSTLLIIPDLVATSASEFFSKWYLTPHINLTIINFSERLLNSLQLSFWIFLVWSFIITLRGLIMTSCLFNGVKSCSGLFKIYQLVLLFRLWLVLCWDNTHLWAFQKILKAYRC